jgi:hypothetical protein
MEYYNKKFTQKDNVSIYQDLAVKFETNSLIFGRLTKLEILSILYM